MLNLYKALANFQQEVPIILKETSGHNYKYADLPTIIETINPILKKNNLGFYQAINGSTLKTVIYEIGSGETLESITSIPFDSLMYEESIDKKKFIIKGFEGMNKAQAIGSLITYFRRYSLTTILGLVTDKDTDGGGISKQQEDVPF